MPNQVSKISMLIFLHFFFTLPVLAIENNATAANNPTQLALTDCDKCHLKETLDINEAGLGHKTAIICNDCHTGHRPKSFENIPACSLCHTESPHYQLQQCLNCHHNPHRPRDIRLPKKAHAECMSCHESQGTELSTYQSYHSELVCTDCHQQHGQLPPCLSCHRGHTDEMAETTCQNCHQPHKPLDVSYAVSTPSSDCVGCHPEPSEQLTSSTSKHSMISCASCHRQKHKLIPSCRSCHGSLHAGILDKFPNCGVCHGSAHKLLQM